MKKLIYILFFTTSIITNSYSQLPQDYPFKTLLDDNNNLLITGSDANNDLFVTKYPPSGEDYIWHKFYPNPGNDRGMDVVTYTDSLNNNVSYVYATGYIVNPSKQNNHIFLIKFNGNTGDTIWTKVYANHGDNKAYGITLDNNRNIYITGYKTSRHNAFDLVTLKYSPDGALLWENDYNNDLYNGDDAGTHLLIDDNYLYVSGYTYNGPSYGDDIVMIGYGLDSNESKVRIYPRKGKEIPTSFVFSEISRTIAAKSRMALGSVTDNPDNPIQKDFLTIFFDDDINSTIKWTKTFNGPGNGDDILTALTADAAGNVFVTGYSFNGASNKYDFASMKYSRENGSYLWDPAVKYFDSKGGNDKASSIKVGNDGNIYIAGTSDSTINGFNISAYSQESNVIIKKWSKEFKPTYGLKESTNERLNKAAKVELDNLGNVIVIASEWDENSARYAIWKYDHEGNFIYSIDNTNNSPGNKLNDNPESGKREKSVSETGDNKSVTGLTNFPNPFNPVTNIRYELSQSDFVSLKVYDILGNEVANLIDQKQNTGSYSVSFDGSNLPSGVYFYKLKTENSSNIRKMTLLK